MNNHNVTLAIVASCVALLAILTVGVIFTPIACILTIISLCSMRMNVAEVTLNALAVILVIIAFATSPMLHLVGLMLLGASS